MESVDKRKHRREFFALAGPNIVSNLAVPVAGLVDIAILGHLDDIAPLAGVALATVIFDFAYTGCNFLRMSTTGLVAAAHGSGDLRASATVFFRSLLIALLVGVGLLAGQVLLADGAFYLLQGGAEVEEAGRAYFHARIWGAPATLCSYVCLGWLLGNGYARIALQVSLLLNGMNVVLSALLVYGLR